MASGKIAARQAAEAERNEKLKAILQNETRKIEEAKAAKGPKKKDGFALLNRLSHKAMGKAIRSIATYKPKSYNPDKQLIDFIKHLFVKYPVPYFMFQCMVEQGPIKYGEPATHRRGDVYFGRGQNYKPDEFLYLHDIYRDWFFCIAQGGSFQKLTKSVFTKKEAVLFLKAPFNEKEIHINIWWAKMKALDIPNYMIPSLIDKLFRNRHIFSDDGRFMEILHFFANHHAEIEKQEFDEITDFIDWKLRHEPEFRYKGRTVSSMIKLSNEWHAALQKAKLGSNVSWAGFMHEIWKHDEKDFTCEVVELTSNKLLYSEGRKQKHCVYSYVDRCANGHCSIFSFRVYKKFLQGVDADNKPIWDKGEEIKRLTIEVNIKDRNIVQVRGSLNRSAESDEKRILNLWAGAKGFSFSRWF
jgi:hypothetical protein